MKKSNIYASGDQRKINLDWFTGRVHMKDVSSKIKSKEQGIYHVYFHHGANKHDRFLEIGRAHV